MDDLDALLREVLEDPAEDTTRLVFADALEERGQGAAESPRAFAEFIRLQVAIAARERDGELIDGGSEEGERELALWSWCYNDITRGVPYEAGALELLKNISRGFVSQIELPTAAFLEHAEAIFRAHPVVSVRLTDREPGASVPNGFHWYERCGSENELPSDAPQPIFKHLQGGNLDRPAGMRVYDTRDEALEALSAACVAFGRKKAGLSELAGVA
jgi:uncharacterized protein (TIGR02996 family)